MSSANLQRNLGRRLLIAIPYTWLATLFLAPFVLVVLISLSTVRVGMPPFEPLAVWDGPLLTLRLNIENFLYVLTDDTYLLAYLTSLKVAAISTCVMLLIAYPSLANFRLSEHGGPPSCCYS